VVQIDLNYEILHYYFNKAAWFVPPQINEWWSLGAAAENRKRKMKRATHKHLNLGTFMVMTNIFNVTIISIFQSINY
jgi:hypothetical protein